MPRETLEDYVPSTPNLRFEEPGAEFIGCLASFDEFQDQDYTTGELLFWPDKQPKMVRRLIFVAISANQHVSTKNGSVEPEDVVSFYVRGGDVREWRDALRRFGEDNAEDGKPIGVAVGDVVRIRFTRKEPAQNKKHNDRHVKEIKVRLAGKKHKPFVKLAEAERKARTSTSRETLAKPDPAPAQPAFDDEDPF